MCMLHVIECDSNRNVELELGTWSVEYLVLILYILVIVYTVANYLMNYLISVSYSTLQCSFQSAFRASNGEDPSAATSAEIVMLC